MKSEWKTEPLQGVVSYIAKGIPPTYVEVEGDNTVRVLNQKCNRGFAISYTESRLHDLSKRSVPQEKYLRDEDILINSTGTGTAGRIAQLNAVPCHTIVDGHMIVLRGNEKVIPRYLGYALKAHQSEVLQLDEGATGQTELNRDRLLTEIEVSYPVSLAEQQAIADTLSALDARITENRVINHHLEQMAQAIFKSWFVDFEPFGGEMPDDWREVLLGEVVEMSTKALNPQSCPDTVLEHYSIPAFDETRLPVFEAASEIKSNKYIIDKDCFLISKLNPTTKRIWRPYCISSHPVCSTEFMVYRAKNPAHKDFYYSVIDSSAFTDFLLSHITGSTGSRQRAIPSETLAFTVILPPDDVIEDFCDKVAAIYAHFELNHLESRRLRQIRDTLLPRLMSGELSVADVGVK